MIKQILRLLFLLAMYELGKYVTEQVYIMMTANDDVEAPSDFAKLSDQSDLMRAEVTEQMYSKESIVNMIGTHKMKCNVLADVIPEYDSNSIAQYGIQATLPKPQGENSSKVEDVVVRLERANKRYAQM